MISFSFVFSSNLEKNEGIESVAYIYRYLVIYLAYLQICITKGRQISSAVHLICSGAMFM